MILVLLIVWVVAAIWLWKVAETEGAAGWWKWLALAVALPLIFTIVGYELSKASRRR